MLVAHIDIRHRRIMISYRISVIRRSRRIIRRINDQWLGSILLYSSVIFPCAIFTCTSETVLFLKKREKTRNTDREKRSSYRKVNRSTRASIVRARYERLLIDTDLKTAAADLKLAKRVYSSINKASRCYIGAQKKLPHLTMSTIYRSVRFYPKVTESRSG